MGHLRRAGPRRRIRVAIVLVAIGAAFLPRVASSEVYRLTDASSYQEGCFDPCLCPMLDQRPALGTFSLRFTGSDGGFDHYAVEDVHWKVPGSDPELRVTGAGKYTIGSPDPITVRQHRLELALRVGDSPVENFDSGWVIGPNLPHIQITISINGMYCYDRVFVVDADPVPASEIQPYALVDGSTFQRGCFDPCDCPIGLEQPLAGTFSLLPLSNNSLFADYGMVDVGWKVQGSAYSTPPDAAITGAGSYRVGGEFAIQQRMEAELQVADEPPASFDSGLVVGGSGFPGQIDVEISDNGKVCFDTVMHVVAQAQPAGAVCGGIQGIPCGAGEFCKLAVGECCCDFQGICTPTPEACTAQWDPVCGCDGTIYGNECEADRAGVSISYRGACCSGVSCQSDSDGDGVPDATDNCPHRVNPGQEDNGGIGSGSSPDGIGDACQCGDVTGDGEVTGQDAQVAKRRGLDRTSPLFRVPGNCDVTGNGWCNGQDGKMILRALQGVQPNPLVAQKCQNADPAAPPCQNCTP